MKKFIIACSVIALSVSCTNKLSAQWIVPPATSDIVTDPAFPVNNVGIGTDPLSPVAEKLTVNGKIAFEVSSNPTGAQRSILGNTGQEDLSIYSNDDVMPSTSTVIRLFNPQNPAADGMIEYIGNSSFSGAGPAHQFSVDNGGGTSPLMQIQKGGAVDMFSDANIGGNASVTGTATIGGDATVNGNLLNVGNSSVGNIEFGTGTSSTYRHIRANHTNSGLALMAAGATSSWVNGSGIVMHGNGTTSDKGSISFVTTEKASGGSGFYEPGFVFWKANSSGSLAEKLVQIDKSGRVAIGHNAITHVGDYRLFVKGGILTEKLKVAVHGSGSWSDYVFNDNYELKGLDEVETYIKTNKHLPDVPSADEVAKDGIDVATMDATLLRKIEELTLYVIEQQKQISKQQKEINEFKSQLNSGK